MTSDDVISDHEALLPFVDRVDRAFHGKSKPRRLPSLCMDAKRLGASSRYLWALRWQRALEYDQQGIMIVGEGCLGTGAEGAHSL